MLSPRTTTIASDSLKSVVPWFGIRIGFTIVMIQGYISKAYDDITGIVDCTMGIDA